MGKLVLFARSRSTDVGARTDYRVAPPDPELDIELWPVAALLFAASVFRALRAIWCHESFGVEPTLALAFVIGLPWLAFRWFTKRA